MLSQNNLNNYQALYPAALPEYVKVDYSLPNQDRKVVKIDPQVFAKKCGMTSWSETILLEPFSQIPIDKFVGYPINQTGFDKILEQTKKSSLVIAYMGEQLGFGVYTETPIAKNDVVSIYTGLASSHFKPDQPLAPSEYIMDIQDTEEKQLAYVDAKNYGNISRFFPHFPNDKKRLQLVNYDNKNDNYVFNNATVEKNIATANLGFIPYWYNNFFITTVKALRDIKAGEWLGVDYGMYWWNTERHPLLIGLDGTVIPSSEYKIKQWMLKINVDKKHFVGVELDSDTIKTYQTEKFIGQFNTQSAVGTVEILPQDFAAAWAKTPITSPYIFVSKPSHSEYVQKAEKKKENDALNKSNQNKLSFDKFKKGFFLSEEEQVKRECQRLFKSYPDTCVQYYIKNKTIVVTHNDQQVINEIKLSLCNQFKIKSGRNEKTKTPMLYIIEPSVEKLRSIMPLEKAQNAQTANATKRQCLT